MATRVIRTKAGYSKFHGVHFRKRSNNYDVRLQMRRVRYYGGSFKNELEAAITYNAMVRVLDPDRPLNKIPDICAIDHRAKENNSVHVMQLVEPVIVPVEKIESETQIEVVKQSISQEFPARQGKKWWQLW